MQSAILCLHGIQTGYRTNTEDISIDIEKIQVENGTVHADPGVFEV